MDRKMPRLRRRLVKTEKKVSTALSQGAGGRGEVEDPARMPGEPSSDLRVLMGGVVVEDGVDDLAGWHLALDGIKETDELLMRVSLHAAAEDDAVEDIEGGKQGGRAVPL